MLSGEEIINAIKNGGIEIKPFEEKNVNPNSYNLTLGDELLVYTDDVLDCKKENKTKTIKIPDEGYVLVPNTFYLASSNESIAVQITNQQENIRILKEFLIGAKQNHDEYQASILESQIRSEEQQLQNLYDSLMQQTATVTELTPEQVQAFQDLSSQNLFMYLQYVNQLSPSMQEELYKVTGIITNNTSVKNSTRDLASDANMMFWREIIPMSDEQRTELDEVSTVINTDTTVETAAGNLGKDANSEFKKNSNGYEAGADFDEGAKRGIEGNQAGAFLL